MTRARSPSTFSLPDSWALKPTPSDSSVLTRPWTYAVDGRQYVTISTGRSNMTSALARLTPDAAPASTASKLFVFALPPD